MTLTMREMMKLVGVTPVAEDVLGREMEGVVLVGLPIDRIRRAVPVAGVARPVLRLGRTGIELATTRASRQLERDRVDGVDVVVRRVPPAAHVLPVARHAVEALRRLRLAWNDNEGELVCSFLFVQEFWYRLEI